MGLVKKAMESNGWNKSKFLLDGFPRSQENIDGWVKEFGDDVEIERVLFFDLDEDTMKQRLLKRGETSGRADDNEEAIVKRF